jgi:hypothetical protein
MDDFFSVPLGTLPPDEPEESVGISPVPAEAYEHRGKWLALLRGRIVAIHDSEAEIYADPIVRKPEITTFHVPPTPLILR